jgi:D-alanine transaminase
MSTVYLNGEYIPKDEAKISVDDRGFLFADGVYEVTPFYQGVPFHLDRHMARLRRGLAWMRIDYDVAPLEEIHRRLLVDNAVDTAETSMVYLQITRGVAPRSHPFPTTPVPPTVYVFARAWQRPPAEVWERGFNAVTVPDRRWARVDIKTIGLLPNVLAYQAAVEAGATDAIQVRDGIALEGAHTNLFGVFDGTLVTHPATNVVLPGITRGVVLELARANGIHVEERPILVEELAEADELFFTGTTAEVRPTVEVDGRPVADGRVGPVTHALAKAFQRYIGRAKEAVRSGTA